MKLRQQEAEFFAHVVLAHWGFSANKSLSIGNSLQKPVWCACEILLRKSREPKITPFACYFLFIDVT